MFRWRCPGQSGGDVGLSAEASHDGEKRRAWALKWIKVDMKPINPDEC
jgi:hypothetical protein